jgi:hypothetical protein
MVARGELVDDTAIERVELDLRVQGVAQQALARVVEGDAGLVARGLDAEDEQGKKARADFRET